MQKAVVLPPVQSQLDVKRLYLRNYFQGLTENFANNSKGTCGYVALGMMLSYFDSYLNDNIILEKYDINSVGNSNDIIGRNNSPGILNDIITDEDANNYYQGKTIETLTQTEYCNILKQKYNSKSLQLRLIELADYYNIKNLDSESTEFSMNFLQARYLCSHYLYTRGYKYTDDYLFVDYTKSSGQDIKQFIIENIDLGRPVFVTGQNLFGGGHAFICYDYESVDKIYGHFGFHDESHFGKDPTLIYAWKMAAFAIDFKMEHTHSYNYMVGDKAYCYCDEAIETYHNHSYERYLNYSKDFHRTYCNCGKYLQSPHWVKGPTGGQRYVKCAACGVQLDTWSDVIIGVVMSLSETANGSYISQSGIPVIMEEDVEAYLSGTLKFGSVIENYDYI